MALLFVVAVALLLSAAVLGIGPDAPATATGIGPPLATSTPLDRSLNASGSAGPSTGTGTDPVSNY
ncbi:MAG: hypothetical protein GY832_10285 [Chloroflexi bacterium]|nr:hypothetical protein [Chloroflexota bacterium]